MSEIGNKLSELFIKVAKGEREIEILRQMLSENYNFNVFSTFEQLCTYSSSLTSLDLKQFFDQSQIPYTDEEVYLLIRQYDCNHDGRLDLQEYQQIALPSANPELREMVFNRRYQRMTVEVEFSLVRLFTKELEFQRELEAIRKQLSELEGFSILEAFGLVSQGNRGFIGETQLIEFLKKHDFFPMVSDIDAIFRRFDTDDDMALSYSEFIEAVMPLRGGSSKEEQKGKKKQEQSNDKQEQNNEMSQQASDEDPMSMGEIDQFETPEKSQEATFSPEKLQKVRQEGKVMFNEQEVTKVIEYLMRLLKIEKHIESYRQQLVMYKQFNLKDIFEGVQDYQELEQKISSLGIEAESLREVLSHQNHPTVLKALEIQLQPFNKEYSDELQQRDGNQDDFLQWSEDLLEKLIDLINMIIEGYRELANFRKYVNKNDLESFFNYMDLDSDGKISNDELKNGLDNFGIFLSSQDFNQLSQVFGEITYNELEALFS